MASWYTVATGQTINAADINQFSNALEVPAGNTEIGWYFLAGFTYSNGDVVSDWITTLNHANAPSTVALNFAILSPIGYQTGSVTTNNLEASGFQVYGYADTSAPNHNAHCGGQYTATY
jgi:hypothetical protein